MSALLFPHSTLLQIRAYSLVPLSVITHLKEGQMEVLNVVHTYCNLLSSLALACVRAWLDRDPRWPPGERP